MIFVAFILAFIVTFAILPWFIDRLSAAGIVGRDMNKEEKPIVAEMGGFAVFIGLTFSILFIIFLQTFNIFDFNLNFVNVLGILLTLSFLSIIGIIDDLLDIPQVVKALIPMFASIPLIALKAAGSTVVTIPFIGAIDFGIFYILAIIPLAITVSANLTNMLAGFNGMEYGMALPMYFFAFLLGLIYSKVELLIFSLAMLGSSLAFLFYNFPKAKVFPGDIGTFLIGGLLASLLIVDNMESYAIVFIPYIIDFVIKAKNGFPSKGWWGIVKEGKLYAPEKPVGLAQWMMKVFNGIEESHLTITFVMVQLIISSIAFMLITS